MCYLTCYVFLFASVCPSQFNKPLANFLLFGLQQRLASSFLTALLALLIISVRFTIITICVL